LFDYITFSELLWVKLGFSPRPWWVRRLPAMSHAMYQSIEFTGLNFIFYLYMLMVLLLQVTDATSCRSTVFKHCAQWQRWPNLLLRALDDLSQTCEHTV